MFWLVSISTNQFNYWFNFKPGRFGSIQERSRLFSIGLGKLTKQFSTIRWEFTITIKNESGKRKSKHNHRKCEKNKTTTSLKVFEKKWGWGVPPTYHQDCARMRREDGFKWSDTDCVFTKVLSIIIVSYPFFIFYLYH